MVSRCQQGESTPARTLAKGDMNRIVSICGVLAKIYKSKKDPVVLGQVPPSDDKLKINLALPYTNFYPLPDAREFMNRVCQFFCLPICQFA